MILETYIDGESDLSVRTKINSNATKIDDAINGYAVLEDVKGASIDGGTFTSGADTTRTLNTISENTITGLSLSANQFTLPAGRYKIEASAPGYLVDRHRVKIRNITDSVDVKLGCSSYANGSTENRSFVSCTITITSTKTFELQHRCSLTRAPNGLGVSNPFGNNIYAEVRISKLLA